MLITANGDGDDDYGCGGYNDNDKVHVIWPAQSRRKNSENPGKISGNLTTGDIVIIQFSHSDQSG